MTIGDSRSAVSGLVRDFYEDMPFNYYCDPQDAADRAKSNPIEVYRDLDGLLRGDGIGNVLEIGCGAGWAANAIALNYARPVTAVDMTQKALDRAIDVAKRIGTDGLTRFIRSDLFDFDTRDRFDLVLSIGVLHHTFDCRQALHHISAFVAKGKYIFLGLYHRPGREPFLDLLRGIVATEGEEAAFRRYAQLHPELRDATHLRSWFRDQVLHPHETQHTLAEVLGWMDAEGFTLISTSINRYGSVDDRPALIEAETAYGALSHQRNHIDNQFFPGFFTILAQRSD